MIGKLLRIRYEVNQSLSEGPVFRAYSAHDRIAAKDVCVRTFQSPFDSELKFIAAVGEVVKKQSEVKHAGIERIFELDDDDGLHFLVGELSPGTPLAERVRRFAPFSVPVAVGMAVSIAEAMAALHHESIVHGDAGTHNVVVSPDGDCRLQLSGIWKAYSASQTAGVVVLPSMAPFLAPEISQGAMPTPASDVYALGVILFQLLTGRQPFIAEQPVAIVVKHSSDPVPSPKALNASIPSALDETVRKAMAKAPAERYPNADAMLSDLRAVQDALRFGKSVGWPPRLSGAKSREPVAPQLSGIQSEKKEERRIRKRDESFEQEESVPGDVPTWLRMVLVFFVSLVVFMVGGWMVFNLNKPRSVAVPDIRRLSASEAEARLKTLNLKLRIIGHRVSDQAANIVLETDPSPGRSVVEGQAVGVVVSDGMRYLEVPDVRGVTPDKAREMLDTLGLKLNDRIIEVHDRSAEPGTIVSQVPEKGQRVERGTAVRIRVATESTRASEDKELSRKYVYEIKIELTDIDAPVVLRVDMTDSRSTKTIHEEQHGPGDEVVLTAEGYGPEADFRIFYDGELVKQVTKKADENQVPQ